MVPFNSYDACIRDIWHPHRPSSPTTRPLRELGKQTSIPSTRTLAHRPHQSLISKNTELSASKGTSSTLAQTEGKSQFLLGGPQVRKIAAGAEKKSQAGIQMGGRTFAWAFRSPFNKAVKQQPTVVPELTTANKACVPDVPFNGLICIGHEHHLLIISRKCYAVLT
jgi:hypothetical protein